MSPLAWKGTLRGRAPAIPPQRAVQKSQSPSSHSVGAVSRRRSSAARAGDTTDSDEEFDTDLGTHVSLVNARGRGRAGEERELRNMRADRRKMGRMRGSRGECHGE